MKKKEVAPEGSIGSRWDAPLPPPVIPQCHRCKHYYLGAGTCDAFFPIRIPLEILANEFDHAEEYPGDEGILFEAGNPVAVPNTQGA